MEKWRGKVAVVTGASSGIGASLVRSLVEAGMLVVGLARRADAIEALRTDGGAPMPPPPPLTSADGGDRNSGGSSGRLYARKCDVTNESEVLAAFAWIRSTLGGVDVFVNNAGRMHAAFMIESETQDFRDVFELNVMAACVCTREAVRQMRERGTNGHVVIVNSVLGHRIPDVPVPLFSVYPASKFALSALVQTVRQELQFHRVNVKVTSISPGMVDTDFLSVFRTTAAYAALPKLQPADVTAAVLYALGTPADVQVEEITLQAVQRFDQAETETDG